MALVVLGVLALYVIISIVLMIGAHYVGKRKGWKWCRWWTVGLVMVLIPTWDILPGRLYFSHLCETEAGVFVYEKIRLPEEYFLAEGERDERYQEWSPYSYSEGGDINIRKIKQKFNISTNLNKGYKDPGNIALQETTIVEKNNGDIIAKAVSLFYGGGWVINSIRTLGVGEKYCPAGSIPRDGDPSIHSKLIDDVFVHESN